MSRPLRVNDIVRVTQFGRTFILPYDRPAWALVIGLSEGAPHYASIVFLTGPEELCDHASWPLDNFDEFTLAPESEVPDAIWAEIAKLALVGEGL